MNQADDQRRTCLPATRPGASRPTWRSFPDLLRH